MIALVIGGLIIFSAICGLGDWIAGEMEASRVAKRDKEDAKNGVVRFIRPHHWDTL